MLNRYLAFSLFNNQSLKLNALYQATCVRKYTLTYDEEEREKKRKSRLTLVNVITPDQKVTSMTIEQAQKMAKRRDLTLSKLLDPPKFADYAGRDVYEMVRMSQHVKRLAEPADVSVASVFKGKKTISFSSTIAAHDMSVKLKQVKKWLSKQHIVVVVVADDGTGECMKEKANYIQTECQDLCQISVVAKKKQMVSTLTPKIEDPQDKENSTREEGAAV